MKTWLQSFFLLSSSIKRISGCVPFKCSRGAPAVFITLHRVLPRVNPQQEIFIGNRRSTELSPYLFKRRLGWLPTLPFFGPAAA